MSRNSLLTDFVTKKHGMIADPAGQDRAASYAGTSVAIAGVSEVESGLRAVRRDGLPVLQPRMGDASGQSRLERGQRARIPLAREEFDIATQEVEMQAEDALSGARKRSMFDEDPPDLDDTTASMEHSDLGDGEAPLGEVGLISDHESASSVDEVLENESSADHISSDQLGSLLAHADVRKDLEEIRSRKRLDAQQPRAELNVEFGSAGFFSPRKSKKGNPSPRPADRARPRDQAIEPERRSWPANTRAEPTDRPRVVKVIPNGAKMILKGPATARAPSSTRLSTADLNDEHEHHQARSSPATAGPITPYESSLDNDNDSANEHTTALDYSDEQLASMTYQALASEPFDHDPRAPHPQPTTHATSAQLTDTLHQLANLSAVSDEARTARQRAFFASLTIQQHEECGDLIIEHLGLVVAKFKAIRRAKRDKAAGLEAEVGQRADEVREREARVDEDLRRLRKTGEDVVNGSGGGGGGGSTDG